MADPIIALEFEKPIAELETKIEELRSCAASEHMDFSNEIRTLEDKCETLKRQIYENMAPWQRVQIARALITAPMVIVADEPFKHLNPSQYKDVLELFANMHKKGATVVLFTQDAAAGHALHAQTLHLTSGKIAKQAEPEKKSHISHADAHRILEEESETILKHSDHMNDHLTDTSSSSHAPRSGKRIRITSIGSNS